MIVDWFTVAAQAINFLILVWLLKRFLYLPILNAIDAREKRIADEITDANARKAEAQKERDEFQRRNEEFDLQRVARKELAGGTPKDNARITQDILRGRKGPKRDIVCLNAAAAMVVGQKAKTLKDGVRLAQQTIDSGAAAEKLDRLIAFTNKA